MSKPGNEDFKYLLASDSRGRDTFLATNLSKIRAVLARLFISRKKLGHSTCFETLKRKKRGFSPLFCQIMKEKADILGSASETKSLQCHNY
jgi:hypothetical protein